MLGKMIGAIAGARMADHVRGINGPGGALLGAGAAALARRLGVVGLAAVAAGGYAYSRYGKKRSGTEGTPAGARPSAT